MDELGLFPTMQTKTDILITIFNKELLPYSQKLTQTLRRKNINTDLYPDPNERLDKQIKYADKKGIPFVAIIGPNEVKENKITVKNLKEKSQKTVSHDDLTALLQKQT